MRHIILFICSILISVFSLAQNQNVKRIVLTDGTVINGQAERQADGTIMVSTTNGDIFFFQPSEVSRIIGPKDALSTESQEAGFDSVVTRKGNKLCFVNSGIALTQQDFYSTKEWEEYLSIQRKGRTGRILLYSGLGGLGMGAAYLGIGFGTQTEVLKILGVVAGLAGLGVGITGLVLTTGSNRRLNNIEDSFNKNSEVKLSFGIQKYGVGLALAF